VRAWLNVDTLLSVVCYGLIPALCVLVFLWWLFLPSEGGLTFPGGGRHRRRVPRWVQEARRKFSPRRKIR
jgi:hypothetical protein